MSVVSIRKSHGRFYCVIFDPAIEISCTILLRRQTELQLLNSISVGAKPGETMSHSGGNLKGRMITLHMVSSLDGFIANKDNTVSWMETTSVYDAGVSISQEDIVAFLKTIDCYVMGSKTYEHALELGWPYGDTPVVVVTTRKLPGTRPSVEFYAGDLKKLVDEKLAPRYRNIWLVGGAMLCQRFLGLGLVDEIKLTIAPVLLGDGLRLFGDSREQKWNLKNVVAYKNGFVETSYSAR